MRLKALFRFIINSSHILALSVTMLLFGLVCGVSSLQFHQHMGLQFIINYNSYSSSFLVQMSLVLLFMLPVYSKLQNDLLRIRCLSHLSFYYLKIKAAVMMSIIYLTAKNVIELLFLLFFDRDWLIANVFHILAVYLIQLGTLIFVSLLLLMLQEILDNTAFVALISIFIIGMDLLFCVFPLHIGIYINPNIFITPMGLLMQHALYTMNGSNPVNFIYQFIYMAIKIIVVFFISSLLICSGRREKFVQRQ